MKIKYSGIVKNKLISLMAKKENRPKMEMHLVSEELLNSIGFEPDYYACGSPTCRHIYCCVDIEGLDLPDLLDLEKFNKSSLLTFYEEQRSLSLPTYLMHLFMTVGTSQYIFYKTQNNNLEGGAVILPDGPNYWVLSQFK